MKRVNSILMIVCAGLLIVSCQNKTKSYTDMLKAEKKAINRLIDENDFEILKHFPKDSVFKSNQFYKLENDVYIQIVDKGVGEKAVSGTEILSRFEAHRFSLDTAVYGNIVWSNYNVGGTYPVSFRYGYGVNAHPSGSAFQQSLESFMSEGFQVGLQYVGHGGKVRMIVPFKRGSQDDASSGYPVYYEILEYKFEENL